MRFSASPPSVVYVSKEMAPRDLSDLGTDHYSAPTSVTRFVFRVLN